MNVDRNERDGQRGSEDKGRTDQPHDAVLRNHADHKSAAEIGRDIGRRRPQPHRPVSSTAFGQSAQGVSVGQRERRREEDRGNDHHRGDEQEVRRKRDRDISERRPDRHNDDRAAQHVVAVGEPRRQRHEEDAHHHRHSQHDADLDRRQSLEFEPDRKERHADAGRDAERGVKRRKPQREKIVQSHRGHCRGITVARRAPRSMSTFRPPAARTVPGRRCRRRGSRRQSCRARRSCRKAATRVRRRRPARPRA